MLDYSEMLLSFNTTAWHLPVFEIFFVYYYFMLFVLFYLFMVDWRVEIILNVTLGNMQKNILEYIT